MKPKGLDCVKRYVTSTTISAPVRLRFDVKSDFIMAVDIQNPFIHSIENEEIVVNRAEFLLKCAGILKIPIYATEQMPAKLGGTDERIKPLIPHPYEKSTFSSWQCPALQSEIKKDGRPTAILIGLETHICVTQTALDLLENGFNVAVCPDACGSSTMERHKLGMERLRDSGIVPVHSETLVYEWMKSSDHPNFREILQVVKESR